MEKSADLSEDEENTDSEYIHSRKPTKRQN